MVLYILIFNIFNIVYIMILDKKIFIFYKGLGIKLKLKVFNFKKLELLIWMLIFFLIMVLIDDLLF